ncbi:phage portal protein [Terrisporobacter petrolearius]|uniref:phage portal protein n=1 Tax=Terrisporobacter petrolearius TaxID=1460447 RepID=UPI0031CC5795
MRKIKMDKDTEATKELIEKLIKNHATERNRILKLKRYYNNENDTIINRVYEDKNKPQNRLAHGYCSYITDNYVGYMIGKPVNYKSDNENLLKKLNYSFVYNDEVDNNTTLAQEQSICGYAYELLYRDENANARFKCVDTEDTIVVYDNTLEEKELFVIRYIINDDMSDSNNDRGICYVYTKDTEEAYILEDNELGELIYSDPNYFDDVPICTYENNRQRIGDFEKVLTLIDAYDQANSDTANDFEYFTNALLVISGILIDDTDEQGRPLNFKDNRVLNFADVQAKAEYLIKNINDTALENYKDRLNTDIMRFSHVMDMTDEKFSGDLSGIAMKYKMQSMEHIASIKESKFKKGLMKRIELLTHFLSIKTNSLYTYTEVTPVFTRNIPANDIETSTMIKDLWGILSEETLMSLPSFVENVQSEIERKKKEQEEQAKNMDLYNDFGSDKDKSLESKEELTDE